MRLLLYMNRMKRSFNSFRSLMPLNESERERDVQFEIIHNTLSHGMSTSQAHSCTPSHSTRRKQNSPSRSHFHNFSFNHNKKRLEGGCRPLCRFTLSRGIITGCIHSFRICWNWSGLGRYTHRHLYNLHLLSISHRKNSDYLSCNSRCQWITPDELA